MKKVKEKSEKYKFSDISSCHFYFFPARNETKERLGGVKKCVERLNSLLISEIEAFHLVAKLAVKNPSKS